MLFIIKNKPIFNTNFLKASRSKEFQHPFQILKHTWGAAKIFQSLQGCREPKSLKTTEVDYIVFSTSILSPKSTKSILRYDCPKLGISSIFWKIAIFLSGCYAQRGGPLPKPNMSIMFALIGDSNATIKSGVPNIFFFESARFNVKSIN